jgi:hypothetical protein
MQAHAQQVPTLPSRIVTESLRNAARRAGRCERVSPPPASLFWFCLLVHPGPLERHLSSFYEPLGGVRLGFLVTSPFQIACTFLRLLEAETEAHPGYGVGPG